ncbi:hypothetical protein [Sulfuricella sp.]|uniref:hypothetical protein n=1 Tax=Sulfuricella sp. TaxID=2099377 RepID=UPI002BF056E6|nr:hypothetical protein [Sulfuricella sp.]HUX64324.1 hypothetical protein [Sulfuricella sp.]
MRKKILLMSAVVLANANPSAFAGSVAGNGGATEITQIMNNAELVTSVGQQADMVATQLQQYILQQVQTKISQQNLLQLPTNQILQNLGPFRGMVEPYLRTLDVTKQLRDSAMRASTLMSGEISAMARLGMDPSTYTEKMLQLAKEKGGYYKQSLDDTTNAMQDVQKRGEALAMMHDQIPGIDSNIKGMQTLATSNMQMTGEMQNMNATLLQMKAQNESKGMESEQEKQLAREAMAQHIQDVKARYDADQEFWKKGALK